jgi:hypothetical protein
MDWSARVVVPAVLAFVLVTTAVVVAVLRLGRVINWPALWVVLVLFTVLLVPVVLVLLSVLTDAEKRTESNGVLGWLNNLTPWL